MTSLANERLHALDAVRGGALLLGVVLHATMSFFPGPIPIWMVTDSNPSPVLSATFFVIHIFRMTLFFMIAGFFARMSFHRKGARGFIVDRAKRIGIPLVVGWPIVFAAIVAATIWAVVRAYGAEAAAAQPPAPMTLATFPLTHLWFLYVLALFYAGFLVLRGAIRFVDRRDRLGAAADVVMRFAVQSPLAALALAAPVAVALLAAPVWMAWFGIPTPDRGFLPNTPALVTFGAGFGFGWLLHRQIDLLVIWRRWWPLNLGVAIGLTAACLWIGGVRPFVAGEPEGPMRIAFAGAYALAIWTWSFGLIGIALQFLSGHGSGRRYLADASYWIYIVHLPLLIVLQSLSAPIDLPWFLKFPGILAVAMAIMLITYHLFVRFSFIGAVLNGRRFPKAKPPRDGAPSPASAA